MKEREYDNAAVYEPSAETIRTGTGLHVRVRDLRDALRALNPFDLRRVATLAGIRNGMNDPMEVGCDDAARDIVDLVRAMPQYCLAVIEAGRSLKRNADRFEDLIRDRRFGVSAVPEHGGTVNLRGARAISGSVGGSAASGPHTPLRTGEAKWHDALGSFFWDTRHQEGEFSYFIRHDNKVLKLSAGQRLSTKKPYDECFLVFRTAHGRYFLRWPSAVRQAPAWYFDGDEPCWFFPSEDDFEELFPGYTYEVFGLKFAVPNIGTDYRLWSDDFDGETPSPDVGDEPQALEHIDRLLEILEAGDLGINTAKALSKQFRVISNRYHPLKHLHATDEEKVKINARYLEIANAYNELKKHFV